MRNILSYSFAVLAGVVIGATSLYYLTKGSEMSLGFYLANSGDITQAINDHQYASEKQEVCIDEPSAFLLLKREIIESYSSRISAFEQGPAHRIQFSMADELIDRQRKTHLEYIISTGKPIEDLLVKKQKPTSISFISERLKITIINTRRLRELARIEYNRDVRKAISNK